MYPSLHPYLRVRLLNHLSCTSCNGLHSYGSQGADFTSVRAVRIPLSIASISAFLWDLIELRNVQLDKIKGHLLGRDETGAVTEPENYWDENQQVEFERYFKNQLAPWTLEDLKLECEDCHEESEDVTYYTYDGEINMYADLCEKCHNKRISKPTGESNEKNSTETDSESLIPELGKIDLSSPEKCEELIQRIKNLQAAGRLEADQAQVMIRTVNNALAVHRILKKE